MSFSLPLYRWSIVYLYLLILSLNLVFSNASALEFRGQVLDADTQLPIEGARISLDMTPGGEVDYSDSSSTFGMFLFPEIATGTYELQASHGGYMTEIISLSLANDLETTTIELESTGVITNDVYVSVTGVMTGLEIEGATVTASGAGSATLMTDSNGSAIFRGLGGGTYQFEVTPPSGGWEPFTTPQVQLNQTHHASIALLPVKYKLRLEVTGLDPTKSDGEIGPLAGVFVELTGWGNDPDFPIVPTRTGVTAGDAGAVFFKDLPSGIEYELEIKQLGYTPVLEYIPPHNSSEPMNLDLDIDIEDRSLEVELENSYYGKLEVYEGLNVSLLGLINTNTEGIEREKESGTAPNMRLFENLIPGRYELRVEGEGTSDQLELHPHFEFVDYVEIFDEGVTEFKAELEVRMSSISGRLWAADVKAYENKDGTVHVSDYLLAGRPFYEPMEGAEIEFVEAYEDPCLVPGESSFTVITGADGFFSVELPPGKFGMKMAEATDYWGSHVLFSVFGEDPPELPVDPPEETRQTFPAAGQGWPFAEEWTHSGLPPSNGTPFPGLPLELKGGKFTIDAFIRKQVLTVTAFVQGDLSPTQWRLAGIERTPDDQYFPILVNDYGDLNDGFSAILSGPGGSLESELFPAFPPKRAVGSGFETDGFFYFEAVPPGTHTLTLDHPRYDVKIFRVPQQVYLDPTVTWEIPAWAPPGVIPEEDPSLPDFVEPFTLIHPGGPPDLTQGFSDSFVALYEGGGPITIEHWGWFEHIYPEDPPSHYELLETRVYRSEDVASLSYIQVGHAGNRIFANASVIPNVPFTFWEDFKANASGGAQTFKLYTDGPQDNHYEVDENTVLPTDINVPIINSPDGGGGSETFPIRVEAINTAEPDGEPISGVLIKLNGGLSLLSGQTHNLEYEFDSEFNPPIAVLTDPWAGELGEETVMELDDDGNPILVDGGFKEVAVLLHDYLNVAVEEGSVTDLLPTLKVFVRRGTKIAGTVKSQTENFPLNDAHILVRDRFGTIIAEARTNAYGQWDLPVNVRTLMDDSPPFFVDVRFPGYTPWRKHFSAADLPLDPETPLQVDAKLVPLPEPTIEEPNYDRSKLFLTGVYFSTNPGAVTNALILSWNVKVVSEPQTISLPAFDKLDGSPGDPEDIVIYNEPAEVYLINTKGTNARPYESMPEDEFLYKPGTEDDPGKLRQWFDDVINRAVPNVYYAKAKTVDQTVPNNFMAEGKIKIWKMPPGEFRPIVAVVSADGRVTIRSDFADPKTNTADTTPEPLMQGVRMPRWMSNGANIMGLAGAVGSASGEAKEEPNALIADALDGVFPKGKFKALPGFSGTIEAVEYDASTVLKYAYTIDMQWKEGLKNPANKWMRFLPDPLGLEVNLETGMGLDNTEEQPYYISGSVEGALPASEYVPKVLRSFTSKAKFKPETTPSFSASLAVNATDYTPEKGMELKVESSMGAKLQTEVEINAVPLTSKIPPPVGPILLSLDKSQMLQLLFKMNGGLGFTLSSVWETKRPDLGSVIVGEHVPRQGYPFVGLIREAPTASLGFAFGGGMQGSFLNDSVGLSVVLGIGGSDEAFGFGALTADINSTGEWPYVKRVHGNVNVTVTGNINLWSLVTWEKSWEVPLVVIDRSFTTEPVFSWEPMNITFTVESASNASAPSLDSSGNRLISDWYGGGSMSATQNVSGREELLVFTGIKEDTGQMTIESSLRSGNGDFASANKIAEAGGILAVEAAHLSSGLWLVVWSEINATDAGNAFPTSLLRYSTSADGLSWSHPELIGEALNDVAAGLRLVARADLAALVVKRTSAGPAAEVFDLYLSAYSDGSWDDLTRLAAGQALLDFDTALYGSTGDEHLVVGSTNGVSAINSLIYEVATGQVHNLSPIAESANSLSLTGGMNQRVALVRALVDGGMRIQLLDETIPEWESPLDLPMDDFASHVRIDAIETTQTEPKAGSAELQADEPDIAYLLSWITRETFSLLNYSYLDTSGYQVTDPLVAEGSLEGTLRDIEVLLNGALGTFVITDPTMGIVLQANADPNAEPAIVRIRNLRWTTGEGLSFEIDGSFGKLYKIQTSSDLHNWVEAERLRSGNTFNDPDAPDESKSFYRIEE